MSNQIKIEKPNLLFQNPLIPLKQINKLIVHHTEMFGWDIYRTHDYHINENGWDGIGYNYFIESDGTIKEGRGLNIGAHAYGHNFDSIGICVTGNFDYEILSDVMKKSLYDLCLHFMKEFNLTHKDVFGHRECDSNKTCPGTNISMDKIRSDLKKLEKSL